MKKIARFVVHKAIRAKSLTEDMESELGIRKNAEKHHRKLR